MTSVGTGYEGGTWGKASRLVGQRKGYDVSHVVTPDVYARTTVYQRDALAMFGRYRPMDRIVWREGRQGQLWWQTARTQEIEQRIMRMARKHERGLRWTVSALARSLHASRSTVQRVIDGLVARAAVTFKATLGRYARMVIRVVHSNAQPYRSKDGQLNSCVEGLSARYWDRYSEDEQDKLKADAYAWRVGLLHSLEAAGFTGPDAQARYLEAMAS